MIWLLSGLSAFLFWWGGRNFGNKLIRRLGCPILALIWIWLNLKSLNVGVYIAFFGFNFGAISTYWDFLGKDMGGWQEETPLCWLATGAGYGLVALPLPLLCVGIGLPVLLLRTVILSIGIMLIRKIPNVHIQELLSGFIYLASLSLLTI